MLLPANGRRALRAGTQGRRARHESRSGLVILPAPGEADRAASAPPRETLERLLPAVRLALPTVVDRVIRARVHRHPSGSTIFYPGYLEHLRNFDPDTLPARIALAGDYLVAPTVEAPSEAGARSAEGASVGRLRRRVTCSAPRTNSRAFSALGQASRPVRATHAPSLNHDGGERLGWGGE